MSHYYALVLFVFSLISLRAEAKVGGPYAPVIQLGYSFYSGEEESSLSGSTGYSLFLRAEGRKGLIRPDFGIRLHMSSGKGYFDSSKVSYSMFEGDFVPGLQVFPFQEGRWLPYVGVFGVVGWTKFNIPNPPAAAFEKNSSGFAYGYMLSTGVDLNFGGGDANTIRIETDFISVSTSPGTVGTVALPQFMFSIGFAM